MRGKLLVEGNDEKHVFYRIFERHGTTESFVIEDKSGSSIFRSIPIELKTDIDNIGIVIDADTNIKSKWDKLTAILKKFDYDIPEKPYQDGTIIENSVYPRIGIWIMPDNNRKGMLEDFVKYLIPQDDKLLPVAQEITTEIEKQNLNRYPKVQSPKAIIHTWLAWQKEPGSPMGQAITKTYLDANAMLCKKFVTWVDRLFNPND